MTSTDTNAFDEMGPPTVPSALSRRADATLALLFEERCEEILDLLSRRWWKWRRPWDAERRANLARVLADLGEARRLEAAQRLPEGSRAHLRTLLRCRIGTLTFDGIVELRDELRKALIPIGDNAYLEALLEGERARQAVSDATGRSSTLLWRDLHDLAPEVDDAAPAARLLAFSEARRDQYRADRKRVQLRQHVMLLLTPVLALLAVGLAIAGALLIDRDDAAKIVLLVVCAGGLGALLGSIRPLRDELAAGADLRSFFPAVLVEPLLGAIAGLLLLLLGETGVLGMTTADGDVWARTGLLAFAAGFLEPYVLRAVIRIAAIPGDDLGSRPPVAGAQPLGERAPRADAGRPGRSRIARDGDGATVAAPGNGSAAAQQSQASPAGSRSAGGTSRRAGRS